MATDEEMADDPATIWLPPYDPTAPVDRSHQVAQLAAICALNSLTLIIIVVRTWYRGTKLKRYRADDRWIVAAGVLLVFPLFVCQIGTNMYGSGLHSINIKPEWQEPHWIFSWGWSAAYLVSAMIRVSVCCCLLDIVPHSFTKLRRAVYCLCALLMSMGITLSLIWLFQYRPFLANFNYDVPATYWIPLDPPRYLWSCMNVPIDFGIIAIPYIIIKKTKLQPHERRIIFLVFAAQILGTLASVFGIWGVWLNRAAEVQEIYWNESVWLILTDLEIFMYTLGATFPMFSRYFILKAAPNPSQQKSNQRTWFKGIGQSITSRFSPRSRSHSSSNSRSYNEIVGLKPISGKDHVRSESSEKLDAVPLGRVNTDRASPDQEWGKTMWVTNNSTTRGDSPDRVWKTVLSEKCSGA